MDALVARQTKTREMGKGVAGERGGGYGFKIIMIISCIFFQGEVGGGANLYTYFSSIRHSRVAHHLCRPHER